ncbi:hypothetical protein DESC_720178 [Desulfosarcina cetonica]|nr:hypothetical protein DESC_720178 [Desulfosarcina cetonica]
MDRLTGRHHAVENGQHRAGGLGFGQKAQGDIADHRQGSLGAANDLGQIVAGNVLHRVAAQGNDGAAGQYRGHAQQVMPENPVLHRIGATGILGDAAAQGGGQKTLGIRREKEVLAGKDLVEIVQDNPDLGLDREILPIDLKDPVHARRAKHDPAGHRHRTATEAGTGPAHGHRNVVLIGQLHDTADLVDIGGKDHHLRVPLAMGGAVDGVNHQVVGVGQHSIRADDGFEGLKGFSIEVHGGHR